MAGEVKSNDFELLAEHDRDSVPGFKQAADPMDQHHGVTAALVAESEPATGTFCEAVQFSVLGSACGPYGTASEHIRSEVSIQNPQRIAV